MQNGAGKQDCQDRIVKIKQPGQDRIARIRQLRQVNGEERTARMGQAE
jgi:hypothetical protein